LFNFFGGSLFKIIIFSTFLVFVNASAATDVVRYVASKNFPDPKNAYFLELLKLTLESTKGEFGDFVLQPVSIEMAQERTSKMLERNELIDLTWRMTSKGLEEQLQAIYFPLLKGMMGYRIFIIRAGQQKTFLKDTSLEKLKKTPVGQGINWPDSEILKSNGFNVVEGSDNHLLKMLVKKRFDYFPRALHEPWLEIKGNNLFTIEQNIALKYYAPIFFFVNKENIRLRKRLDKGLAKLINSGEFDALFANHPMTSNILMKANLGSRKIFELVNPIASKRTQDLISKKHLWLELQ